MKTISLLIVMFIATSTFAQAASSEVIPKSISPKKSDENNLQPNNTLVINIDQLRKRTKDVSLLRPVFIIVSAVESFTEKIHAKKLKITCNKSYCQRD